MTHSAPSSVGEYEAPAVRDLGTLAEMTSSFVAGVMASGSGAAGGLDFTSGSSSSDNGSSSGSSSGSGSSSSGSGSGSGSSGN